MTESRAVLLTWNGPAPICTFCFEPIKGLPSVRNKVVVMNCYQDGVWNRVEHAHPDCYDDRYGPVIVKPPARKLPARMRK